MGQETTEALIVARRISTGIEVATAYQLSLKA
jgi:hypothetical protein